MSQENRNLRSLTDKLNVGKLERLCYKIAAANLVVKRWCVFKHPGFIVCASCECCCECCGGINHLSDVF